MPTPSLFDEMLTATGVTAVAARARSRLAAVVGRGSCAGRDAAGRRRGRGGIVLRDPPLTSRIGGVGDRAARRAVRAAVFHLHPALSPRRGRQRPTPTATAGGLGGGLRARDAREVERHDAAATPHRP